MYNQVSRAQISVFCPNGRVLGVHGRTKGPVEFCVLGALRRLVVTTLSMYVLSDNDNIQKVKTDIPPSSTVLGVWIVTEVSSFVGNPVVV